KAAITWEASSASSQACGGSWGDSSEAWGAASPSAQNCSGTGLLKLLKYSMTDAGVSGEGTQSANALPPNDPAINNAISQRLVMCSRILSPQRSIVGGSVSSENMWPR